MKTLGIYSSKNTSPTIYCLLFKPYICHYDKKHTDLATWQMFWPSTYSIVISPMENLLQRIDGIFKPKPILRLECSVFLKNFEKKNFFWYYYFFWKDLSKEYLVISKFLSEVPKFRENVLICIITVTKVSDLLLTLLQVITMLAT